MSSQRLFGGDEQSFHAQVSELYKRGRRLRSWARSVGMLAGVAVIACLGCWLLVRAEAPVSELKHVDIPASVIDRFLKAETKKHINMDTGAPFASVVESTEPVAGSFYEAARKAATGPLAFTFSIIGVMAFGIVIIFAGHAPLAGLARPGLGICVMVSSLNMALVFFDDSGSSPVSFSSSSDGRIARIVSPRDEFLAAVKGGDLCKLVSATRQWAARQDGWDVSYVLAQVYLRPHVCQGKPLVAGEAEVVDRAFLQALSKKLDEKRGFTPDGEVAYLVDMHGYGEPVSALAKRYLDARAQAASSWSAAWRVAAVIAGVLVVMAGVFFWLSRVILGRAVRIWPDFELLKPDSTPTTVTPK